MYQAYQSPGKTGPKRVSQAKQSVSELEVQEEIREAK